MQLLTFFLITSFLIKKYLNFSLKFHLDFCLVLDIFNINTLGYYTSKDILVIRKKWKDVKCQCISSNKTHHQDICEEQKNTVKEQKKLNTLVGA